MPANLVEGKSTVPRPDNDSGAKPERDRLRQDMLSWGYTLEQIAAEMARRWRFRPRKAWRHAYGLSQDEVAEQVTQLFGTQVSGKRISDYEVWPDGGAQPTPVFLAALARVYGTVPEKLLDFCDREKTREDDIVMAAARESSDHAAFIEEARVDTSIDGLHEDVVRMAQFNGHPQGVAAAFPEIVQVRNRIYSALDGHHHPSHTRDLYFLAGVICGVLNDASHCLGNIAAANEQVRAAWTYAELAGHNSLRVWCRTAQVMLAIRDDRYLNAFALSRSGEAFARDNSVSQARLYSSRVRSLGALGDKEGALAAFRLVDEANSKGEVYDDLFDGVGGTFGTCVPARNRHLVSGFLRIGLATQAAQTARQSIEMYEKGETKGRSFTQETSLRIQLANAYVLSKQVDAARDALVPVFALPLHRRLAWFGDDMKPLVRDLAKISDQRSTEVRVLQEQIEDFFTTSLGHQA